jgi:hypothetical protein
VPTEGVKTVEFEPLTNDEFGFRGLAPVGWEELAPTKFMRGESALDQTVLIQEAAPISADVWLDSLPEQLRLDDAPQSAGSLAAGDLTWDLYAFEIQGQAADLAMTEHNGQTYMVLLVSFPGERDALYESVFLPVVEALRPIE